ncbi:methionyl-tRNA formyltransferase [Candidatus Magnetomorum sp. HK-1]|nr:methionyl-tRNA formyltransferase [Candidatus Magnetomorum sp. HK-1]
MESENYVVATIKSWNIKVYNDIIEKYPGKWFLITDPKELTVDNIKLINPKYIFFPHWSNIVPDEILNLTSCVCFHETNLPYGRGSCPLQNLIANGYKETVVSALKMTKDIDAGPVYLKEALSLEGLAEEIYIRNSYIVAEMIKTIISVNPKPKEQVGKATIFKNRKPSDSKISSDKKNLQELFDHIRMLDAETYPRAFIENGSFRYEISRPALRTGEIIADVHISKINGDDND